MRVQERFIQKGDNLIRKEMLDLISVLDKAETSDLERLLNHCKANEARLKVYGREADASWLQEIRMLVKKEYERKHQQKKQSWIKQI